MAHVAGLQHSSGTGATVPGISRGLAPAREARVGLHTRGESARLAWEFAAARVHRLALALVQRGCARVARAVPCAAARIDTV